jgi:nitrogen-specific signal transduction histidine kinase
LTLNAIGCSYDQLLLPEGDVLGIFPKKTDAPKAALSINEIIKEIILLLERELLSHQTSLRLELAPELPAVLVDRVQMQQVLINLIMIGIEAMGSITDRPRELTVRSRRDVADQVLVAVQDNGVGIDPEHMDRLFNAFFTTKPAGMSMGYRSAARLSTLTEEYFPFAAMPTREQPFTSHSPHTGSTQLEICSEQRCSASVRRLHAEGRAT